MNDHVAGNFLDRRQPLQANCGKLSKRKNDRPAFSPITMSSAIHFGIEAVGRQCPFERSSGRRTQRKVSSSKFPFDLSCDVELNINDVKSLALSLHGVRWSLSSGSNRPGGIDGQDLLRLLRNGGLLAGKSRQFNALYSNEQRLNGTLFAIDHDRSHGHWSQRQRNAGSLFGIAPNDKSTFETEDRLCSLNRSQRGGLQIG